MLILSKGRAQIPKRLMATVAPRSKNPNLCLKFVKQYGKILSWENRRGERFVSGGTDDIVSIYRIDNGQEHWIISNIHSEDGELKIESIMDPAKWGIPIHPLEERKGRGLFGVILTEAVSIAFANNLDIISVIPMGSSFNRLATYYMTYPLNPSTNYPTDSKLFLNIHEYL